MAFLGSARSSGLKTTIRANHVAGGLNMAAQLGRLERADVRTVWKNEAADFTPWLASPEGIEMLSAAIEFDLELRETEKPIGRFSADLVCGVPESDKVVLVENQFGTTDHDHLGKMLTYAAALDEVVSVVWIAERFHDEHRAALDWLNQITPQTVSFVGMEIEVWTIAGSPPAPKFNIVCQPNDWSRPEPSGLSELQQLRLAFWTTFKQYLEDVGSPVKAHKPGTENWANFSSGIPNMVLVASVKPKYLDVVLYSHGGQKKLFAELEKRAMEIESLVDGVLEFSNDPNKKHSCVGVKRDADIADRDRWPEYMLWLSKRLAELKATLTPLIAEVQTEMAEPGTAES